jgi:hypothetical protein
MNMLATSQYHSGYASITNVASSGSANQMAVLPQIKLYLYHMKKHPTRIIYMCIHLNIYFIVKRVLRQVPPVKLEVHTLPNHLRSSRVSSRVRVAQSLVFCVVSCRSLVFFYFVLFL